MTKKIVWIFFLCFCAWATLAQAAALPEKLSCAKLQLGEPEIAVEAALGKPLYTDDEIVFGCPVKYYAYADNVFVGVSRKTNKIVDIKSYAKKYALNDGLINFGDTVYHVTQVLGRQPLTRINGQQYLLYDLQQRPGLAHSYLLLQINGENKAVEGIRLTSLPLDSEMALDGTYWKLSADHSIADADLDTSAVLRAGSLLPKLQIVLHN